MNNGKLKRGDRVRVIADRVPQDMERLRGRVMTVSAINGDYVMLRGHSGWHFHGWFERAKETGNADAQAR